VKDSHEALERLMGILREEGETSRSNIVSLALEDVHTVADGEFDYTEGTQKRRELGVYLSLQRIVPF